MTTLIVTIDVEEDLLGWQVPAQTSLRNLDGLPRIHALCRAAGVRPTYLCSWLALTRPEGEALIPWHRDAECEVGTLLHPWSTPPFDANESRLEAQPASAMPASSIERKLDALTEAVQARFGAAPKSFRAGRFALSGATLQAIERRGYAVDASVLPYRDGRGDGGVDTRLAPDVPYFPDRQRPARRGRSPILEVPVTVGPTRPIPEAVVRWLTRAPGADSIQDALAQVGGPRIVTLEPGSAPLRDLTQLLDACVARRLPMVHLTLRSSHVAPCDGTQSAASAQLEDLVTALDRLLGYATTTLGMRPRTLTEFAQVYLNG